MFVRRRRAAAATLAVTAAVGLSLTGIPNGIAAPSGDGGDKSGISPISKSPRERKGYYDARLGTTKTQLRAAREIVADAAGPSRPSRGTSEHRPWSTSTPSPGRRATWRGSTTSSPQRRRTTW